MGQFGEYWKPRLQQQVQELQVELEPEPEPELELQEVPLHSIIRPTVPALLQSEPTLHWLWLWSAKVR